MCTPVNLLVRDLHPALSALGIPRCGFHAFRRYRNTFLRQSRCPESILKYWMGHSKNGVSDLYDKSSDDVAYRRDVSKAMGVGFVLPESLATPSYRTFADVAVEATETLETVDTIR
jgi:hypothetical protein